MTSTPGWRVHLGLGVATQRQAHPGGARFSVYRPDPTAPVGTPAWRETGLFVQHDRRGGRDRRYGLYRAATSGPTRLTAGRYLADAIATAARLTQETL